MKIHNPSFYLLDYYYTSKYVECRKTLKHKSINYFISSIFNKSQSNKKFNTMRPIFNAMCSYYFKKNVVYLKITQMIELLDHIDESYEIIPRKYHLEEFYEEEPLTPSNYKSLMLYNFYDGLLFEYSRHGNRDIILKKMENYNLDLQKCSFI